MNNTNTLRTVGESLYGPRWQSDLARDLDVTDRTVRRWMAGVNLIPVGVWLELVALMRERKRILDAVLKEIPR